MKQGIKRSTPRQVIFCKYSHNTQHAVHYLVNADINETSTTIQHQSVCQQSFTF